MNPRNIALALAGLLLATPTLRAQDHDLEALEKKLKGLAEQSIPKTVLIKAIVGPGREGAGSGALISADGYILTCTHVIEIGNRLEVSTADGKTYVGKVVGKNIRQDYSLIKIEAANLPFFKIGDSSTVKTGQWVAALGHPGGPYADKKPAFAAGKVRALDVKLPVGFMKKYYNHAIMTDVPIYAGDSGGPLINDKGELVGINGAIVMINEMAFAVPINQIMKELPALKAGKTIEGEAAGPDAFQEMQKVISPKDYQKLMKRSMSRLFGGGKDNPFGKMFGGKDNPFGKLFGGKNGEMPDMSKLFEQMPDMKEMMEKLQRGEMPDMGELFGKNSPFGKGGKGGPQFLDLRKLMEKMQNGEMPDLQEMMKKLQNGEMPDMGKLFGEDSPLRKMFGGKGNPFGGQNPGRRPAPVRARPVIGLRVVEKTDGKFKGLLVNAVQKGGPADKAGVKKGDLLLSLDGIPTTTMGRLGAQLKSRKAGDTVELSVRRAVFLDTVLVHKEITINVKLGGGL